MLTIPYEVGAKVGRRLVNGLDKFCERIELAGELRRGSGRLKRVRVVAVPHRPKDLFSKQHEDDEPSQLEKFIHENTEVIRERSGELRFVYGSYRDTQIEVDMRMPLLGDFAASLLLWTGDRNFLDWIRENRLKELGLRLHKGGLYTKDWVRIRVEEEDVLLGRLKLPWIPPSFRQDEMWLKRLPATISS